MGLVSGIVTALGYPPTRLWPLAVLGTALGLWVCAAGGNARRGALCGFAWALGFCGVLFRWALDLHVIAYLLLVPVEALFWLVSGAVAGRLAGQSPALWVGGVAAAWTLAEALRARWPLGGFAWGQLGVASADLPLRHASAVVGTLGVTALVIALAAALVGCVFAWRRGTLRQAVSTLGAVVVVGAALAGIGALGWTSPAGELEVAVVQVDPVCPGLFAVDCPNLAQRELRAFLAGTQSVTGQSDLIMWGEGALRGPTPEAAGRALVAAAGGQLPAPLLTGVISVADSEHFYNRNVLYAPDGTVVDSYAKRHAVPFGEFIPLRDLFGAIADVGRLVPLDMFSGTAPGRLLLPVDGDDVGIGTVVSWEVAFARDVRASSHGSELLTTLTTQSSYGVSTVSDQLLGIAQMRAAELQKSLVVAASTGRSAVVLPGGELAAITALYAADTLTAQVPLRTGATPFARWGDLPIIILAAAGTAAALWRPRRPMAAPELAR